MMVRIWESEARSCGGEVETSSALDLMQRALSLGTPEAKERRQRARRNGPTVRTSDALPPLPARAARVQFDTAAGARGSCLSLWRKRDLQAALWELRHPRYTLAGPVSPRGVVPASMRPATREDLCRLAIGHVEPFSMPPGPDMVRDAWVSFIQEHLGTEDVCFFTGSYRDDYGYPMGLMLARNVQRDFKRFLAAYGFDARKWVCAVEKHPSGRLVLHVHALIAGMSPADMAAFEHAWTTSRGWSKAVPCHDGGVRYCCKYALKGFYVESFEWSW